MAYPGKNHKQYATPKRRFEKTRLDDEKQLIIDYGLRNKRELWKAQSILRKYRAAARELVALRSAGITPEIYQTKKDQLISHLYRYGLVGDNADVGDVLALKVEQQLDRRLQTQVLRKGLARTPKQARQFITHGHIAIGGQRVTVPGYRVTREEEPEIGYYGVSPLTNEVHPERGRITRAGVR
ncbi:30S ribosomal protein S4 [Methanoculleus receptaculi]|jgi:small subunit ribosomal protein S4|uniref:Small ribosomal subunit protein uS4 n=1 Tax=Methanoculleus receptaculi TaxID=394967 RepID=A0AAX4FVZ1_9EURY|nr:30S ribosomal protein S4 [Methanoculleus receptaculi]MDI3506430.1 small subunit ribosomal protein [Methanomicrobiaceae archaeon]MDK2862681.1 small subunit ribosomal protein [Methanomicrobiaceae archaeon]WOX57364.1 30S ribosomal protein S4 [Methanoculleus receptaculi]